MLILRDDPVIEVFDSPDHPPSWIEAIDIENAEYQFCDDHGQRYIGVITRPSGWIRNAKFQLRPEGRADLKKAMALVDRAEQIEPNDPFPRLESLRQYLIGQAA